MATINQTTLFDVGDKVWMKSSLDSVTTLTPASENKYFIEMTIPLILFKVTQVKVRKNEDGTYSKLYAIKLFLPEANTIPDVTGAVIKTEYTDILETSLYSYSQGITKINAKIVDFQTYLSTLDSL